MKDFIDMWCFTFHKDSGIGHRFGVIYLEFSDKENRNVFTQRGKKWMIFQVWGEPTSHILKCWWKRNSLYVLITHFAATGALFPKSSHINRFALTNFWNLSICSCVTNTSMHLELFSFWTWNSLIPLKCTNWIIEVFNFCILQEYSFEFYNFRSCQKLNHCRNCTR